MAPAQAGESREVAIGRDQLAPVLDRERGEVGVRHHVALRAGLRTDVAKDFPMARAR
jgi:hypothetical protein